MDLWTAGILAHFAEEFLHPASGLVNIDDFARLGAYRGPCMNNSARKENALTINQAALLIADFKMKLTVHNVYPFILILVKVARPAACACELKDTHGAFRVPGGNFTIIWFASEPDVLV